MKDLTEGKVLKTILLFSIPLVIGNVFQLLYSFIDSLIVGNILGVKELAGVGATGSLNFFIVGFANGMASGCCIMVARFYGAHDDKLMHKAIAHSLILGPAVAITLSILSCTFLHRILLLMNTPEDVIGFADSYIRIIFGGMVISMFYNLVAGFLRSVGDSMTPLYFLIVASLINIVLDILFMGVLKIGVAGAAIATLISQVISVILCVIFIFKKYRQIVPSLEDFKLEWPLCKELLGHGFSLGFQSSIIAIGNVCVQTALNALGSTYMAANTAANKVSQLFMQPLSMIPTAMSTFASQNLGAKKITRIRQGMSSSLILVMAWAAFSGFCSIVFGPQLVGILVKSDAAEAAMVIEQGCIYLRLHLIFFLALGPLYLYRQTLQGIGNKIVPVISGTLELLVKIAAVLWITPNFGYVGIAATEPIAWVLCAAVLMIFFYRDPRVKVIQKA